MSGWIKAAVLVQQDGRFLLVQEEAHRAAGLWNWPQGKVEPGETPAEAAVREAREETGLDVSVGAKLAVLQDTFPDIEELHVFLATIVGGQLTVPGAEIRDAKFFSVREIEAMREQLIGPWVLEVAHRANA
jgi:mutator protein MutT